MDPELRSKALDELARKTSDRRERIATALFAGLFRDVKAQNPDETSYDDVLEDCAALAVQGADVLIRHLKEPPASDEPEVAVTRLAAPSREDTVLPGIKSPRGGGPAGFRLPRGKSVMGR